MKSSKHLKPVLWSLFLATLAAAPVISFFLDGLQGAATTVVAGLIALQARVVIVELEQRKDRGTDQVTA